MFWLSLDVMGLYCGKRDFRVVRILYTGKLRFRAITVRKGAK